ncbi:MFS transporter [Rickettsia canadensis]|uniref:Proline/betaine transporter n=1 Tax=Rickettsia canadensis str. CA410 TaxID=1105107 RepID=A0ABN4A8R4_RICCA|nr:MFS transporter [Rickettsia canadensis]AFB20979.1 proline/betaine transporter [Rickettsia canadensis str. CA410]
MLGYEKAQTSLNREQKETIRLLSIGTFLEYFDLMIYVHMAVLLNELLFPKADTQTAAIYSAAAFCSTFVFRPFVALLFGWIGDKYGRKSTVIITTLFMACFCAVMAGLPTYVQIGVMATWIVTICRIIQGMSSLCEIIGAELYLTETINPPKQYPVVSLMSSCAVLGGVAALGLESIIVHYGFSWRITFFIGTFIAITGSYARTHLRETRDFIDAKQQVKNIFNKASINIKILENNPIWKEKVHWKTSLYYFLIHCTWPVTFYITYIYCSNILKSSFNYTSEEIITHNFIVSLMQFFGSLIFRAYLSGIINPLKILKGFLAIFSLFILIFPYLLNNLHTPRELLIIQSIMVIIGLGDAPAVPIFFKHFPIFKRFTYSSFLYALSRALIYVVTSFGIIYLVSYFGHWGILVISIPLSISYGFGILHFEKLEKNRENYLKKKQLA